MRYMDLGRTGVKVSQFALGTGMLGARKDRSVDRDEAYAIMAGYVAGGGNLIDTSDAYQGGLSEELIGSFAAGQRDDLILASKYSRTTGKDAAPARVGNHRKSMVQGAEASLKRLKTDRLDLYFAHYDDGVTPIEEIMRGFDDLASAGKILYAGLSNFSAWRTAQAATTAHLRGWTPLACLEVEYSLLQRSTEREILPLVQSAGLGVLAYSPLAAGVLTSAKPGSSAGSPSRMGIPSEGDATKVLETLRMVAAEAGAEPAHVALAWLHAKGAIPVLGARVASHLQSSLGGMSTTLTGQQVKRLDEASAIPLGYPMALQASREK